MADILIKNMEMPKKGCFLFQISANGDVWVSNRNDEGTGIIIATAIELPPHGRLIDYDWVKNRKAELEKHFFNDEEALCMAIDEAPTILEAST